MLKIYGSKQCPDCVQCCQELEEAKVEFEYFDFADSLKNLKDFLNLRDTDPAFDAVRSEGKIGIPCIVREDGSLTLQWDEFTK